MERVGLPFQPGSISWDVLRRPVFLIGGMSALLLQVAEPRVAAGVARHSDFTNRIFDRLEHTVDLMVEVGLSDPADANRALRDMGRAHRGVRGPMPDGSTYDAADPELRLWVVATLIATVLAVEERYVGEFDEGDRRRYYRESLEVARALRVGDAPSDLDEFRSYMNDRIASLQLTSQAREIASHVLRPRIGRIPPAVFAPMRTITADLLPPRIRQAYGLHVSAGQNRGLHLAQASSRTVIPKLPDWIRTFPILHPAEGMRDRLFKRADARLSYRQG